MKRLIVNADDFGLSDHTYEWTVKGFECGALTSATVMAGMPATAKAVAYAKDHPEFSFGVHLCLVDEQPLCRPEEISSMVDPRTGRLWATRQFILRNFTGRIRVDDLEREMTAQLGQLADMGLKPSHFDGHGHNHRLPASIMALKKVAEKFQVRLVRRCQDMFCARPGILSRLINGPMQRRLTRAGFRMTDHFAMNAGHCGEVEWFSRLVAALPEGITEIGVHPGVDEAWRRVDIEDCYRLKRQDLEAKGVELVNFLAV